MSSNVFDKWKKLILNVAKPRADQKNCLVSVGVRDGRYGRVWLYELMIKANK